MLGIKFSFTSLHTYLQDERLEASIKIWLCNGMMVNELDVLDFL